MVRCDDDAEQEAASHHVQINLLRDHKEANGITAISKSLRMENSTIPMIIRFGNLPDSMP